MKITVRKLFDELYDVDALKQEVHTVYGQELISALRENSPVDTGRFKDSWMQTSKDDDNSFVWNRSGEDQYLLGTGVFVGHSMWRHGNGGYLWRADGPHPRGPWTRGINPVRIAKSIDEGVLSMVNKAAHEGSTPWTNDSYKISSYNFIKNMRDAISNGLTLAVRRLKNGNNK